jgi:hypothetical protein
VISEQSKLLSEFQDYEGIKLWLFLLSRVKRSIESPLKTNILEISNDEIWDIIYPYIKTEPNRIIKIKKDLEALGLNDNVQKFENELNSEALKNPDVNIKPPINRIIVDGSNVAREGLNNEQGSAIQLINVYNTLKEYYKFDAIVVIIGAGLRYKTPDFDTLKPYIEQKIIRQAPAGTSDDFFIINYAIDNNTLILTNDMYREFKEKYPKLKEEIEKRRVTFMINPDNGSLSLGQFPDYKNDV